MKIQLPSTKLDKIIAVAKILSVMSLLVMVYNIERIINFDYEAEKSKTEEANGIAIHVVMVYITSLAFFMNLLLCQGALDLVSIDLYFWPDPAVIKVWWILVYVPLLFVYSYGSASCFYLAMNGSKNGNLFVSAKDNHIAWGLIYLTGDIILTLSIHFLPKWYSKL